MPGVRTWRRSAPAHAWSRARAVLPASWLLNFFVVRVDTYYLFKIKTEANYFRVPSGILKDNFVARLPVVRWRSALSRCIGSMSTFS